MNRADADQGARPESGRTQSARLSPGPGVGFLTGIEAFKLIGAGAGILGYVEYVDLATTENNSHANRRVPEAMDTANAVSHRIVPKVITT